MIAHGVIGCKGGEEKKLQALCSEFNVITFRAGEICDESFAKEHGGPIYSKQELTLFLANSTYLGFCSIPIYFLPFILQTANVVPDPANGSRTISPSFELANTKRSINFSGF